MTTQTLSEQIKTYRQEHRLTQSDMGAMLGVTGSAVGQWETGATTPRGKHRAAIQRILREEQPYQPEVLRPEQIPAHVVELSAPSIICPDNMTLREYMDKHNMEQLRSISPGYHEPAPNPQAVTIDWQSLVIEYQGTRGVSLRHLVGLGLYANYRNAREALDRAEVGFLRASAKTYHINPEGGRPSEDTIITDLRLVQMFCVCAQTPLGVQIRDVVIAHHNELQAMLAGDEAANARHEQAKLPEHPKEIDPLDALSSMISQLREQRDRQRALEREMEATRAATQLTAELVTDQAQRLADVETRLNTAPIAGHLSAYQIAERGGYLSSTGRPHASAVVALGDIMGLEEEGEAYRVMTEINEHICPTRRYTPVGAAMLSRELARLARAAKAPFFNVIAGSKTYTVYRAQ